MCIIIAETMRILGIDPGIARTGWAILEKEKGNVKALSYGCFETDKKLDTPSRLLLIYKKIISLIDKYSPNSLALEDLFFNNNAKTALLVGQARGVVILAASTQSIPVSVYTPLQVKIAVTGYGRAEKGQVGKMVKTILNLSEVPKLDDTSDALAVALAHAFSNKRL
jgi:crossover junction endodeoxyribonuclease RuvC